MTASFGDLLVKWAKGEELSKSERDQVKEYADTLSRSSSQQYVSSVFTNTNTSVGVVTDAPNDNKYYSRRNLKWQQTTYPHYYNLTVQVTGSATHFTITEASHNLLILVNGIAQGENDFVYDLNGLGFTLDVTLVSGDVLEIFLWPGGLFVGSDSDGNSDTSGEPAPLLLSWSVPTLTGSGSSFAAWVGTIPVHPSFPTWLKIPASFVLDAATNLTCFACNGVTHVLTGTVTTDASYIYVSFTSGSPVSVTQFELVLT